MRKVKKMDKLAKTNTNILQQMGDPLTAIKHLGHVFAQSGMFGVRDDNQGQILAMTCMLEGRTPIEIMRTYHFIDGKLSKRADAMHAEFQQAGGFIRWDRSDEKICMITLFHKEYAPEGITVTVDREHLDKVGVTSGKGGIKDNWRKWPKRMLQCRAISEGIRQVMPSIVAGVYTLEEISDFDGKIDIPPAEIKETKVDLDRAKKVINYFNRWGIVQEDLERYLGESIEPQEPQIPINEWSEDDFARLKIVAEQIMGANDQFAKTKEIFNLEPGALG